MQLFIELIKRITGESSRQVSPRFSQPIPVQVSYGLETQDSPTRPTQRIKDHEQLKIHRIIDLAG